LNNIPVAPRKTTAAKANLHLYFPAHQLLFICKHENQK
jgi:hypothetical protein